MCLKMQESSGDELLRKLSTLLKKHERPILRGESKLCLTVTSTVYLNRCFEQLNSAKGGNNKKNGTEVHYCKDSSQYVTYLHDLTRKALFLKLIPGPSTRFDVLLNISHFKNLQYLEIKKVPLGYIIGLQGLRKQLKGFTCMRSAFALNEVFVCCGGDLSTTPFAWQKLQEVNLSYNSISHIDDSVKVLPVIEVLNLSHNNIASPDEEDYWQFLTGLHYLNLGYNQLNKVPSLPAVSITRFQLKILILRNNNIQNLRGIQHFGLLETLDIANNCITSFQELFPLAHLHSLSVLHLAGNPVCFYEEYRLQTVSCLSPVPHQGDIYLDNQKLSPLEKSFVGSNVQPASLLSYLPYQPAALSTRNRRTSPNNGLPLRTQSPQGFVNQPLEVVRQPEKKKKKARKLKTRQISIVKDVEEDSKISASSSASSPVEPLLDHSQDIERLEKARDLGGAHWLPAVNNVLHSEATSLPTKTSSYQDDKSDISNASPYVVSQEQVTVDVNLPSSRKSSSSDSYQSDEGVNQPFLVTLKALHLSEEEQDDDEGRDFLVTITEHFIRERDCDKGKVTYKLEIGSLLSANLEETEDGDFVVHMKFDYLSRDRKERYYIMEDRESAEQLIGLLFPMIMSNKEAKNVIVSKHLQCLKCSAYFTEHTTKSPDQHICPDCGSTKIIGVNPVEKSRDLMIDGPEEKTPIDRQTDVTTGDTWLKEAQKMPDLIPKRDDSTVFPQPDIYSSSKEYQGSEKQNLVESPVESTEKKRYTTNSTGNFKINDSVEIRDSTMEKEENTKQNGTDSWKKSNEDKNIYAVNKVDSFAVHGQKSDFVAKSALPTRTSALSNSLKDSCTGKSNGGSGVVRASLQRRVIDSPISLKRSSFQPSTVETDSSLPQSETISPQAKPSAAIQSKIPVNSSPAQSNVILNLFTKLSYKMSGPLLSSSLNSAQESDKRPSRSKATPIVSSRLMYDISPDEFRDCDHRLKLYFEVSLFKGGSDESLSCLIKAPVVVYGNTEETCALLVISNMAVYICKLVESAGLSATECLSLISSHSLSDLQYVDFGAGNQIFRLEFDGGSPACYTFYVRDKNRCETFLHLFIKSANLYKAKQELEPVKITRSNPQTLAHIRSQVLGIQKETLSAMGERFLEQLEHFTEPPLIKDRKSLLRSYPRCFVGREFVDWLIGCGEVITRQQGVDLAQNLVDGGVIEHVSKESKFEDKEQFYRFIVSEGGRTERGDLTERDDDGSSDDESLGEIDSRLTAVIMAYRIPDLTKPLEDLKPVTIAVTRTHIALAEENPQWPFPRYLESAPAVSGPQFHCIVKYKMTDVTSLEFFSDNPCHVAIIISEEDGPLECADSYLLIKTETRDSLSTFVQAIQDPWEQQFGVELQTVLIPSLEQHTS